MSFPSLVDQVSVTPIAPTSEGQLRFRSTHFPQRLGNALPIAYGGCAAAVSVSSAYATLATPNMHMYSLLGAFHGPARTDRPIICTVSKTRDTRTFATRRVVASQKIDLDRPDGEANERTCMDVFVDFHVLEAGMMDYDPVPAGGYHAQGPMDPAHTATNEEIARDLLARGEITPAQADANRIMFAMSEAYYETRPCLAGVSGQNLMGLAKHIRTTQDHLPMPDKTSAEWIRTRAALPSESAQMAALAFIMDAALSFLPLNHDHKNFADAGACSTLDFALRVMTHDVDLRRWHVRERRTVQAGIGRTYGESRIWDQKGRLVGVETQTCILRPLPAGKEKKGARAKM